MAHGEGISPLHALGRGPLPLWALAYLGGQATAGVDAAGEIVPATALGGLGLLAFASRRWWLAVAILLAVAGHAQVAARLRPPSDTAHVAGLPPVRVALRARVLENAAREGGRRRLLLEAEAARRGGAWGEARGRVQLTLARPRRDWPPGALVEARLKLRRPRNFGNPGEFDYEGYLARRGVWATAFALDDADMRLLEEPRPGAIDAWRARVATRLQALDSPARELLAALILGEGAGVPRRLRQEFAAAGVSHVLAISGLHVAMVGGSAFAAIRWLLARSEWLLLQGRVPLLAAALSLLPVWLYAELARAGVATWRALAMLAVVVAAVLAGRRRDVFAGIAAAAIAVGTMWPGVALELSFQLSFSAVVAIVLAMDRFWRWWRRRAEARLYHLRGRRFRWLGWVLAGVAVNLAALAGTAPLTALHFNQVPLAAMVANPLVVPLTGTAAVALGLLGAVTLLAAEEPAHLLLRAAGAASAAGAGVASWAATLPGAGLRVVTPTPWEIALLYGALVALLVLGGRPRRLVLAAVLLLLLLDVAWALRQRWWRDDLRVTFLSVGQGDATVLELPGSAVMLVDGGGLHGLDTGERIVAPQLWQRRIARLDVVVLTHADFDHYGGLEYIVRHFRPREIWHAGGGSTAASFESLMRAIRVSDATEVLVRAGERREIGGCDVDVLWPHLVRGRRANDDSVVLRLQCPGVSVLLPGDLEAGGEAALVAAGVALQSDVLKAGHHGSRTSSTRPFLAAVRPRAVVVSAGWENRYGLPHPRVLESLAATGAAVLRTDLDGAVVLERARDGEFVLRAHRSTVVDSPGGRVYRLPSRDGDASGTPDRPLF